MKLRQEPEDFIVREEASFEQDAQGGFFVYRLDKRGLSTIEVLDQLARKLRVPRHALSASGLKDKHANTSQLIAAPSAIPEHFRSPHYQLEFLGRTRHHLTAAAITRNHFAIVARDLDVRQVEAARTAQAAVEQYGIPNYFDSQRFGGLSVGQGFVADALVRGDFELALKRHLAAPYRKESRRPKQAKRLIASKWGDWAALRRLLPRGPEFFIVEHLAQNPGDFRGAFHRIPQHLRVLYLSSLQSYYWNLAASAFVLKLVSAEHLRFVPSRMGPLAMYTELAPEAWREVEEFAAPRPHPSISGEGAGDAPRARFVQLLEQVLREQGLELSSFRVPEPTRTQFQALDRRLIVRPEGLAIDGPLLDRRHPGRVAVRLSFALPRGSYGTLVVKRLLAARGEQPLRAEGGDPDEEAADADAPV
jgi:tRNA pseudouridine13 synthase